MKNKVNVLVIVTGLVIGAAAVLLTKFGNPANMGFCIACFLRDIAGATKLHTAKVVQYFRPEIVGIIFGSLIISLASGEWRAKAGSSPATRFVLGFIVMIGALIFLGCPLRMVIRMGGGDLNAFVGLAGFVIGILIGVFFLRMGFGLKKNYDVATGEGVAIPVALLIIFALVIVAPTLFVFSTEGPGSKHAPLVISLVVALIVGALAQKSRMCMVGGVRDVIMFKNFGLLLGFVAVFVAVIVGNVILGNFKGFSSYLQPISHASQIWNLVGMIIVGWGSCLLGGCPLRQLILTGEGNADSALTVVGMIVGAAFAHNFSLAGVAASKADDVYKAGGLSANGKGAAVGCIVVLLIISILNTVKGRKVEVKE